MGTKKGFWRWVVASAATAITIAGTASARIINDPPGITTIDPAAIVVYPSILVDVAENGDPQNGTDTLIQLTNTIDSMVAVKCFYVNANGHCSNNPAQVCTQANARDVCPTGGFCIDGWQETDFRFNLTKRQPISWSAFEGLPTLPNNDIPGRGDPPQFNEGSIPPVPENPFTGELRCIQLDPETDNPIDRNDLKGEATIVRVEDSEGTGNIDASKYNAIGIPAIPGAQDGDPNTLNLGGPEAEYRGCPHVYTLDHFFEGARVVTHNRSVSGPVFSDLTFVPCAADFLNQDLNLANATIQFLIFNEFEQRFSTSTKITCYRRVQLADIDTLPGPSGNRFSIFSIGTQGTLTGQTRMRAVAGPDEDGYQGRGVLALLQETWASGFCVDFNGNGNGVGGGQGENGNGEPVATGALCFSASDCGPGESCLGTLTSSTTAANVQYQGSREQGDRIIIPLP
jgi:hypothetical protein